MQQGFARRAVRYLERGEPSWQFVLSLCAHTKTNSTGSSVNRMHARNMSAHCTLWGVTMASVTETANNSLSNTPNTRRTSHLQPKVPASPQLLQPCQVPQRQCRPVAAVTALAATACTPPHGDLQLMQLWWQVPQLVCVFWHVPHQEACAREGGEGCGCWQQQVGAGTQHCEVLKACGQLYEWVCLCVTGRTHIVSCAQHTRWTAGNGCGLTRLCTPCNHHSRNVGCMLRQLH